MFVTNIGSILKDGWLETKAVLFEKHTKYEARKNKETMGMMV